MFIHMNRLFVICLFLLSSISAAGQDAAPRSADGIALSPARFELEMQPGTEKTVIVNLDYRSTNSSTEPARLLASLNDWTITKEGRVEYFRANTQVNSASPWLIYTPGEAAVKPGTIHQIRVTVVVPPDAKPGDHMTALVIEQRPETIKHAQNVRQMIVRYRMASVFYIKVGSLVKQGSFENLIAQATESGIVVVPTLKNAGNSVVRPTQSIKIVDADGKVVADMSDIEPMPVLRGGETNQSVLIGKMLPPGNYSVRCRVDFHDGSKPTEGVTDLAVTAQIASADKSKPKP